jgi:WD40 repeat protein
VTGDAVTVWSLPDAQLVAGPIAIERQFTRRGDWLIPQFSRDGRQLVVVDPQEAIHVFDAATGTPLRSWPHVHFINPGHLQILPDGRLFTEGAANELWDPDSGLSGKLPSTGWKQLRACASDRVGARLLLTTSAGFGLLVSTATGELLAEETSLHESGDMVAALSPDGGQIAVGTGSGDLRWMRAGRGAARPLEIPAIAAAITRDTPARIRCVDSDRTRLIDVASGRVIAGSVPNPAPLSFVRNTPVFSPGARFLVLRSSENPWDAWDYGSGAPRVVRLAGGPSFPMFKFDPDGNFLARFGRDLREAGVWDLSTGELSGPMVSYENDQIGNQAVGLGPAGARLATGHSRGAVAIWETATGRLVTTLAQATRGPPSVISFNPDGRRLVVSTAWGEARVWDAQTGKPLSPPFEIPAGGAYITTGAVFSPDGRWIATNGPRGVVVRDAMTFAPAGAIIPSALPSQPRSFFSRDGTRLVAGASLRVWEAPGGDQITEGTDEHNAPGGVGNIQLSPDGRYLSYQMQPPSDVVVRIRSIPPRMPDGEPIPEWLLQLASVLAGRTVNDAEECVSDPAAMRQIDEVRRELATLSADAPYAEWGRWILDDRVDRPIAPGFTITPAEAEKLAGRAP